MRLIEAGVRRFSTRIFPKRRPFFERLGRGQNPKALFITCADSRVVPNLITQAGPGDLFVERNPGNIVPYYMESIGESASVEYAVAALKVDHIFICGHSDCGAIKGILDPESLRKLPATARWLGFAEQARRRLEEAGPLDEQASLAALTEFNVVAQLDNLRTHPSVAARLEDASISLHGWVYEIETGRIRALDWSTGEFSLWPDA